MIGEEINESRIAKTAQARPNSALSSGRIDAISSKEPISIVCNAVGDSVAVDMACNVERMPTT